MFNEKIDLIKQIVFNYVPIEKRSEVANIFIILEKYDKSLTMAQELITSLENKIKVLENSVGEDHKKFLNDVAEILNQKKF